jgi:hypothetical protein
MYNSWRTYENKSRLHFPIGKDVYVDYEGPPTHRINILYRLFYHNCRYLYSDFSSAVKYS